MPESLRLPTPADLLSVWEAGLNQPPLDRSLHLLRVSAGATDLSSMATLSIGERDARLLQLREWLFGTRLTNLAHCPSCAQPVEWENDTRKLLLQTPVPAASIRELTLEQAGFSIRFRLPNSYDLHRAMTDHAYQSDPTRLLIDCVLSSKQNGEPCSVNDLPANVVKAIDDRMAEEDPQADIDLLIDCPGCGHGWTARFDIMPYLWQEIDSWARHLMQDVFLLARTFGWAERDILQMAPTRRQLYIDMIRG